MNDHAVALFSPTDEASMDPQRLEILQRLRLALALTISPLDLRVVSKGSNIQSGVTVGIAFADDADDCLEDLAGWFCTRIRNNGSADVKPALNTLVLVLPELPSAIFKVEGEPYLRPALALQAVGRVVVLACPGCRQIPRQPALGAPWLGRDGAQSCSDPKVTVIDISGVLDRPLSKPIDALGSLEVIGIIGRLLRGMNVIQAIGDRATVMSEVVR